MGNKKVGQVDFSVRTYKVWYLSYEDTSKEKKALNNGKGIEFGEVKSKMGALDCARKVAKKVFGSNAKVKDPNWIPCFEEEGLFSWDAFKKLGTVTVYDPYFKRDFEYLVCISTDGEPVKRHYTYKEERAMRTYFVSYIPMISGKELTYGYLEGTSPMELAKVAGKDLFHSDNVVKISAKEQVEFENGQHGSYFGFIGVRNQESSKNGLNIYVVLPRKA